MNFFSHIYIEEEALAHPSSAAIWGKFPGATLIPIRHYKEVFNRPRQDFRAQKTGQNLILAMRREDFYYEGSSFTPSCGCAHFYYNALVLNCLYDCGYCYLQGLFPGAHMVMFVNNEDYLKATGELLREKGEAYLCISYDTDLLALERYYPYTREWIEFAKRHPRLTIEVRTKSANYKFISDISPTSNVLIAWTLSPAAVSSEYEARAPDLDARLRSLRAALSGGWRIRVCIDPILRIPEWQRIYGEFLDELLPQLKDNSQVELNLGFFRMNHKYLHKIKEGRRDLPLLYHPFARNGDSVSYAPGEIAEMRDFLSRRCELYLSPSQVLWSPGA